MLIGTKISPSNTEPEELVAHYEASLGRLQTDYLDLYIVHWPLTAHPIQHFSRESIPTPSVPIASETLLCLCESGKIRYLGVSNFGVVRLSEALATGAPIVLNELPYSLLAANMC